MATLCSVSSWCKATNVAACKRSPQEELLLTPKTASLCGSLSLCCKWRVQSCQVYPAGPAFKMAGVPARDQLGRGIAQKATLSLKRKAAARAGTPMAGGLPTGRRRAAGTPLPLSSAGKRLASSLRGGTPATDVQLRASYKSTPRGRFGFCQVAWNASLPMAWY